MLYILYTSSWELHASNWEFNPGANVDIKVLVHGNHSHDAGNGIGVDDGVERESIGGAVVVPLWPVHLQVETAHNVFLPVPSVPPGVGAVVVFDPFQE